MFDSSRPFAFIARPVPTAGTGWFSREGGEFKPNATHGKRKTPAYAYIAACGRCGGAGGHVKWNHTGWTCFDCGGKGTTGRQCMLPLYSADELARLNAQRDKARARKAAKAEAARIEREAAEEAARIARADMLSADPLFLTLTKYADRSEFFADVLKRYRVADLSEKQIAAVTSQAERFAKADAIKASSRHLGQPGERVPVVGVVTFMTQVAYAQWPGGPGARYLNKIETDDGCVVVWFASRAYAIGARMQGKATVKDHSTYKDVAQTVVKNFREAKTKS